MFEDTFLLTPTQGWMFLPIQDYHSGGAAAAFEPLSEHLDAYEWALAQYLGAGVGACYRGSRLFDTNATRAVVQRWVAFYKRHRAVLTADLLHLRRPDLQGVDFFMHAAPRLEERGLLMVFNPTQQSVNTTLALPLYYAGLDAAAWIQEQEDARTARLYPLDRLYHARLPVQLAAMSFSWFLIKAPPSADTSSD